LKISRFVILQRWICAMVCQGFADLEILRTPLVY